MNIKKYYKYFIVLLVISFIIPQIALAAWWNPFSWSIWNNIFRRNDTAKTQALENRLKELESKLEKDIQNTPPAPETTIEKSTDTALSTPKPVTSKPIQTTPTPVTTKPIITNDICSNIEGIQTSVPTGMAVSNGSCAIPVYDVCNNIEGTQTSIPSGMTANNGTCSAISTTPTNTTVPAPTPVSTEKNYYYEALSRVNTQISIYQSYKSWLQDTSDQFRSASLTLAGYPKGGLYGDLINATIDLANANVTMISGLTSNANQWISYYQTLQGALTGNPKQLVDQSSYDKLKNPTTTENELASIKNKINVDLAKVLDALQYH